jgi:hypothetical protein
MAQLQLLTLACLALLASSTLAADCVDDAQIQSATLTADKPKGCLTEKLVQETVGLSKACFASVTIYRQAGGASCNQFGVGLLNGNNSDCIGGPVGNGTLVPAKGGGYTANGQFLTGQDFAGTQSADNKTLTVSVDGFNCELTYTIQGNTKAAANATASPAASNATRSISDAPTPTAPTPTAAGPSPTAPAKGSGAAALPSVALLVVGAVMAVAF